MTTRKAVSQTPYSPNYPVSLQEKAEQLVRNLNRLVAALSGRTYADIDIAGSLAIQQYGTLTISGGK